MPDEHPKLRLTDASAPDADITNRDDALVRGLLAGDAGALGKLIDHYDRLVRYTIHRGFSTHCARDPSFLDARASEVWTGFVDSVRRTGSAPTGTLAAYLARIARNKCADFLRRVSRDPAEPAAGGTDPSPAEQAVADDDPLASLIDFERIDALRACMAELPENDRKLLQELDLITNSRWSDAAERLDMAESTLRSRWTGVLKRLRAALEKKRPEISDSLAPDRDSRD